MAACRTCRYLYHVGKEYMDAQARTFFQHPAGDAYFYVLYQLGMKEGRGGYLQGAVLLLLLLLSQPRSQSAPCHCTRQ